MADQHHRRTRLLGETDHRLHAGAHLRHRAGRGIGEVAPQCLDRIDDDEIRPLALRQRRQDILDIGFCRQKHIGIGRLQALRPQPHLRHRLFARDIDDPVAAPRQRRRTLHQQRRLADAGIAADQHRRPAHEAAAERPVEFRNAGVDARSASSISPDSVVSATGRPFFGVFAGPPPIPPIGSSSTMVFHSPQPSHLPAQRLWMVPQFWQMNCVLAFAMKSVVAFAKIVGRNIAATVEDAHHE
jgi:hypothetical protein